MVDIGPQNTVDWSFTTAFWNQ
uniref:Uncharacterized protein n=1 Tax=Moniliophthora roreri TaxID=221103 RepID=A0A0W0EU28_MONRR